MPGPMDVDLGGPGYTGMQGDGINVSELGGGALEVDLDPGNSSQLAVAQENFQAFDANLAKALDKGERDRIAQDLIEAIDADLAARSEWNLRLADGMSLLGVIDTGIDLGVFEIAKKISHPIIAEAVVQYQARAIAELFPPEGVAKATVLGQRSVRLDTQAERVAGYLNYQMSYEDRSYFEETDQLLFMQALEGSEFRKVYRDPIKRRNVARWVRPENFIVPYNATSLETALRYTHRIEESHNELLKKQRSGFYIRDIEVPLATTVTVGGDQPLAEAKQKLDGVDVSSPRDEDVPHTIYEVHCDLDLKGFEDKDEVGESTGIQLPYIVHIEKDLGTVLAVYRNWREPDPLKEKRIWFTHYKYLPGTGFYGFGLLHLIGGLGAAATAVLRAILVTAAFSGTGGGFKAKGTKIAGGVTLQPGVYVDTDSTYEELKQAFYTPDFKATPTALFQVLGHLVESGHRFASTTEVTVGDAKNTGPVGTTIALIEQGQKVFSGIHKRSHMALGRELVMRAELNGEHLPDGGYPYEVPGETRTVMAADFDERIDVAPVSDPNISSNTQRIAIAQTTVEMADKAPDIWDRRKAHERLAKALKIPDVEDIIINKALVSRADPVSENALCIVGQPVQAYEDQDHAAHMAVHRVLLEDEEMPKIAKGKMAAHIAEHLAHRWRIEASQAMGIPPVPINFDADPGKPAAAQLPPDIERQVSMRAAQAMNKLRPPQKSPEQAKVEGDLALKKMKQEGELKIRAAVAKHKAALERFVAFQRLETERLVAIERMKQEGKQSDAKFEQDRLNNERSMRNDELNSAATDLQDAVMSLAEGLSQVGGKVQSMQGGAGEREAL